MNEHHDVHLVCHRCGVDLTAGKGNFYVVRIEAFADPTPPNLTDAELQDLDVDEEINRLIDEMRDMSARDLMEQVYRRLTIHLCGRCYKQWIEDPAR